MCFRIGTVGIVGDYEEMRIFYLIAICCVESQKIPSQARKEIYFQGDGDESSIIPFGVVEGMPVCSGVGIKCGIQGTFSSM